MGYRSQVESVVYGEAEKVDLYIVKHKMEYGDVNLFSGTDFNTDSLYIVEKMKQQVERYEDAGRTKPVFKEIPYKYIRLSGADWKWYDEYDDVKRWDKFMTESEEFGLNYEFARVGEEEGDAERRDGGEDVTWILGIHTSIEVDL